MASKTLSPNKSKSQPKPISADPHEERYGELRDKLSDDALREIVEDVCGKNYDETAAAALVLLMDEIERAQLDAGSLENIVLVISRAAFRYTVHCNTAEQNMIARMRREFARKELVN